MKIKLFDVQNVAVGYVCLWATAPILAYGDIYRYMAAASVAIWLVLEMVRPGGIVSRPTLPVAVAVFFIAYTGIVELLLGVEGDVIRLIQVWILLFFLIFYESRRDCVGSMRPMFWLMILTMPLWLYSTYAAFDSIGSHVARDIVRSSELAQTLSSSGIGGYSLVYGTVLALPLFVTLIIRRREILSVTIPKFLLRARLLFYALLLADLLLGIVVVFRAGYTIAIMLAVFTMAIAFLVRRKSVVYLLFLPLAAGLSFLLIQVALEPGLLFLQSLAHGTPYESKFRDILATLSTDQAAGSVDDRLERYQRSLGIFAHHPFFGVLSARDVGKHSVYLDGFARYGMFFGSMIVYLLLYLPVRMMRGMNRNFGFALSVFAVMLIFPLVNNVFASLGVILFIMIPVAGWMLGEGGPMASPSLSTSGFGRRRG